MFEKFLGRGGPNREAEIHMVPKEPSKQEKEINRKVDKYITQLLLIDEPKNKVAYITKKFKKIKDELLPEYAKKMAGKIDDTTRILIAKDLLEKGKLNAASNLLKGIDASIISKSDQITNKNKLEILNRNGTLSEMKPDDVSQLIHVAIVEISKEKGEMGPVAKKLLTSLNVPENFDKEKGIGTLLKSENYEKGFAFALGKSGDTELMKECEGSAGEKGKILEGFIAFTHPNHKKESVWKKLTEFGFENLIDQIKNLDL